MTNTQNSLNRLIESIKKNKMILIAATTASIMTNVMGSILDVVEFRTLINPKPTDLIDQGALVKITGWSVGSYNSKKLKRTSKFYNRRNVSIFFTKNRKPRHFLNE